MLITVISMKLEIGICIDLLSATEKSRMYFGGVNFIDCILVLIP